MSTTALDKASPMISPSDNEDAETGYTVEIQESNIEEGAKTKRAVPFHGGRQRTTHSYRPALVDFSDDKKGGACLANRRCEWMWVWKRAARAYRLNYYSELTESDAKNRGVIRALPVSPSAIQWQLLETGLSRYARSHPTAQPTGCYNSRRRGIAPTTTPPHAKQECNKFQSHVTYDARTQRHTQRTPQSDKRLKVRDSSRLPEQKYRSGVALSDTAGRHLSTTDIDWKGESLAEYPFKCFLERIQKGITKSKMAKDDEEKNTIHTIQGSTRCLYKTLMPKECPVQKRQQTRLYIQASLHNRAAQLKEIQSVNGKIAGFEQFYDSAISRQRVTRPEVQEHSGSVVKNGRLPR
ncbi:hypothetical protein Tco_1530207 [Tanacetum coccineum]